MSCDHTDAWHDDMIDHVLNMIDMMLSVGEFDLCDKALRVNDPKDMCTHEIVAWLSAVSPAVYELQTYGQFYQACQTRLQIIAPERAERLIAGFERPPTCAHHEHGVYRCRCGLPEGKFISAKALKHAATSGQK